MERDKIRELETWKEDPNRRPLIIRGARQVGKTWLVREFAKQFQSFVEVDFELDTALGKLFEKDLNPHRLIRDLSAVSGRRIIPGETLLFLDEAQAAARSLQALRFFYEEIPELHVIVAGSLLNMVLESIPTGVGRVSYLNLYPLTFAEYLVAAGEDLMREMIQDPSAEISEVIHNRLLDHVRMSMLLGGMPAVLTRYFTDGDILACRRIQEDLLQSYMDDFRKYAGRADLNHLLSVFYSVPVQLGRKYVYARVDSEARSRSLSKVLSLLDMAGVVNRVFHTSATGIPLASGIRHNRFKVIFLDTGLVQCMLDVDLKKWLTETDIAATYSGALAEQFVGQELAAWTDATPLRPLTYWHREKPGSTAEVDYLTESGGEIIPIEVKKGAQGGMKSLHLYLREREGTAGVKVSPYQFSDDGMIRSVPFYGIERLMKQGADRISGESPMVGTR